MKAISLWQPWASAMASGAKRIETRSWATAYRGDLLICSAKRIPTRDECGDSLIYEEVLALPYGYALAVVELYDCVPTVVYCMGLEVPPPALALLSSAEESLGNYAPNRFAWLTRNLRPLPEPLCIVGRQGLWNIAYPQRFTVRGATADPPTP